MNGLSEYIGYGAAIEILLITESFLMAALFFWNEKWKAKCFWRHLSLRVSDNLEQHKLCIISS